MNLFSCLLLAVLFLTAPLEAIVPFFSEPNLYRKPAPLPQSSWMPTDTFSYLGNVVFSVQFQLAKESSLYEDSKNQLLPQTSWIGCLHLPEEIATFFQSVPINIVSTASLTKDQLKNVAPENFAGDYDSITPKTITLPAEYLNLLESLGKWNSHKNPIVLYFLCMALLDQRLPQGVYNPDIKKYFEEAKAIPYYQNKNPDWMSSELPLDLAISIFFADAAVSYLCGSCLQEPSSCFILKEYQPEFFHYLENLFGPQSGFLNQSYSYHGYFLNTASVAHQDWFQSNKETIFQEFRQQVTYIEQAGLPNTITNFFKSIPLRLVQSNEITTDASGEYLDASILLKDFSFFCNQVLPPPTRIPILLHELLHAFHEQRLPQGWANPDILQFYHDAITKEHHYYKCPDSSNRYFTDEWRENGHEFFACTATAFLAHTQDQEPTKQDDIFIEQPEYYNYLQALFFGARGTAVSVLSDSLY